MYIDSNLPNYYDHVLPYVIFFLVIDFWILGRRKVLETPPLLKFWVFQQTRTSFKLRIWKKIGFNFFIMAMQLLRFLICVFLLVPSWIMQTWRFLIKFLLRFICLKVERMVRITLEIKLITSTKLRILMILPIFLNFKWSKKSDDVHLIICKKFVSHWSVQKDLSKRPVIAYWSGQNYVRKRPLIGQFKIL